MTLKFNLGNFPKHEELSTPLKTLMTFQKRVWRWLEGFEAELRELRKYQSHISIKEILDE